MAFHVLGVSIADHYFEPNHILRLVIRCETSLDHRDWSIACFAGNPMRDPFLQCIFLFYLLLRMPFQERRAC